MEKSSGHGGENGEQEGSMDMGFEQLGKKLLNLGQDAKSGMQKVSKSYQVSGRLDDEKRSLSKMYAVIGKYIYEKNGGNPPEGLEDEFTAVKVTMENVDRLSRELNSLRGRIYCTECGEEAGAGESFCIKCGAKLPEPEEKTSEKMKRDMKEAAGEMGLIVNDMADKTKELVGDIAEKADAFLKGMAARRAAEEKEQSDGEGAEVISPEDISVEDTVKPAQKEDAENLETTDGKLADSGEKPAEPEQASVEPEVSDGEKVGAEDESEQAEVETSEEASERATDGAENSEQPEAEEPEEVQENASDADDCDEADGEMAAEDVSGGQEMCSEPEASKTEPETEKTDEVSETEEMAEEESAE